MRSARPRPRAPRGRPRPTQWQTSFADWSYERAHAPGKIARGDLEQRVPVAACGVDDLVIEQRRVEHHGQAVADGRHATDGESGRRSHLVARGLPAFGTVERIADLVLIDAMAAGRDDDNRLAVHHED